MTIEARPVDDEVERGSLSMVPVLLSGILRTEGLPLPARSSNTCIDFLPAAVCVERGIVVSSGTRVTEVNRETTDDR